MNIIISLDYEIFFGIRTGSVEKALIEPTEAIAALARKHAARLSFFVDAGFLIRLRENVSRSPHLGNEYSAVRRQLDSLVLDGHEIQLHVHPHWEDSWWNGQGWIINTKRYRLHDFEAKDIFDVINRYHAALSEITDRDHVVAFRGGGWVIQPFDSIAEALFKSGIRIDSTVFPGGTADSATHWFDFRDAPKLSRWRFDIDPLVPTPAGRFLEMPIASHKLGPFFFWRLAWTKKSGSDRHRTWGNGEPIQLGKIDLLAKLIAPTVSVVSVDGYKASFLKAAYENYRDSHLEDFVIIGHPKALTRFSLEQLDRFLGERHKDNFSGYRDFLPLPAV